MKMNKIGKIVKYNLEKNLRNSWFIGLNAILLVVAIVALNFTTIKTILENKNIISKDKEFNIEILDNTNIFYNELQKNLEEMDNVILSKIDSVSYDENMSEDRIIIEVKKSNENIIDVRAISKDGIDKKYYTPIEKSLETTKEKLISERYNITLAQIEKIKGPVEVERIMVGVDNSNSDVKQIAQTVVSYITLLILMLILSKIAGDISQEKITKSIEYVLTSISAKDYLIAKVISINLTMIIQVVFTFVYFIIASSINSILNMTFGDVMLNVPEGGFSLASIGSLIDSTMILYILVVFVFLILTVLFMCIVQAAMTSKTTNMSEAGNTTTILLLLNFVLYFVSTIVITPLKETNIIFYILSCIPIVSMYFVPSMIIIGQASVFQVIIATILLIVSIPVSLKICAKIFKNGVLNSSVKKKKEKQDEIDNIKEKEIAKVRKGELAKYGYVIGMSVIIYVVLQFILTYSLVIFLNPIHELFNGKISIETIEMLINMFVFIVSLLLPALFVNSYIDKKEKVTTKLQPVEIGKIVAMAAPFVFFIQIVIGWILEKIGLNYDIVDKIDIYKNTSVISSILFFIYIAILPAIFEEFYIRKAVINFSKKYGNAFAIISSAILFAVLHMNISQSLFAFMMGVLLGVIAIKTNSIIPTGIIHFLNNGYAALIMIFEGNTLVSIIINMLYITLCVIGLILCVISLIKNWKNIKIKLQNMKGHLSEKRLSYKYIAFDYIFIIACILMVVMLILTQKTLEIL